MSARIFGTLFYANYLPRALALHRSLQSHFHRDFTLFMLGMDDIAVRILDALHLRNVRVIAIADLEAFDRDLVTVKSRRSVAEYCWTCTPSFLLYLLHQAKTGDTVSYLDADMMFFSDPQPVFDEWAKNDILIHEHRFAPAEAYQVKASGIFNIGWLGVRDSAQGRRCMDRWRTQCLEACTIDKERGLYGDQKYLDEWPNLYDRLSILKHKGAGLAPWNIGQYQLSVDGTGLPFVDDEPLIFYHYHAMRIHFYNLLGHTVVTPARNYRLTRMQIDLIYRPYLRALNTAYRAARSTSAGSLLRLHPSAKIVLENLRFGICAS